MSRQNGRAAVKDCKGAITTKSGVLNTYPFSFASRLEGKLGTNA